MQARVPNAQWSQTNWKVGVWGRERFTRGLCKDTGGSCLKTPKLLAGFQQSTLKNHLIYLFTAVHCWGLFSSCEQGLLSNCSVWASHCSGFCCCGAWALGCVVGSVVGARGLICSVACGIFPDQGSNLCPLHWQAILNHWATREAQT